MLAVFSCRSAQRFPAYGVETLSATFLRVLNQKTRNGFDDVSTVVFLGYITYEKITNNKRFRQFLKMYGVISFTWQRVEEKKLGQPKKSANIIVVKKGVLHSANH